MTGERLHFFWGDERFVPFTDERNNAKMAFEELLDHVPLVKEQIHVMQTGDRSAGIRSMHMKKYCMIILINSHIHSILYCLAWVTMHIRFLYSRDMKW